MALDPQPFPDDSSPTDMSPASSSEATGASGQPEADATGDRGSLDSDLPLSVTQLHIPIPLSTEDDQPTVISKPDTPVDWKNEKRQPADIAKELIGVMLDHYRLDEFIGGGGMGAVFKAHDTLLGRTVAVKILSRSGDDQEMLRRFVNEAQSAAKLDHENIARVFFVGQALGWNYIVFEFIEGKNIRQIVAERGPLELELAMRYMCQMARALEHAGNRQVIHRDIKPSNVIITPDHRVKLVDMGLARMRRLDADQEDLTASGMTLGTFDYISPEQARDPRLADTRSDIYSLGCTFFYMLTGMPPFPDGTPLQKLLSHQEAERPNPKDFRPDLPELIVQIVRKQLAPNPNQRYQAANELLADLLIAATELDIDVGVKESLIIEPVESTTSFFGWIMPFAIPALCLAIVIVVSEFVLPTSDVTWDAFAPTYQRVARPMGDEGGEGAIDSTNDNPPLEANTDASGSRTGDTTDEVSGSAPSFLFDPGSTANSNRTEPPMPPSPSEATTTPVITTLRVGRNLTPVPGSKVCLTLGEAVALANADEDINEIQLCFNGFQPAEQLEVHARKLSILAGSGYRPALRFSAGTGRMSSPHLVRLYCEEFTLRGVDMEVVVSGEGTWRQVSWFHLEQDYTRFVNEFQEAPVQDFNFVDCRFTVTSSPSSNPSDLPTLSLLQLNRPDEFFLKLPSVDVAQFPNILLRRTLVRGQCHLIRSAPATPFYLLWEQGLFVSGKVACQLGGVTRSAEGGYDQLNPLSPSRLELRSVTVVAPGLVEIRVSSADPEPLRFTLDTSRCWFEIHPDEALIHHRLLTDSSLDDYLLKLEGQENLLLADSLIWQVDIAGQVEQLVSLDESPLMAPWFGQRLNETHSSVPVIWQKVFDGSKLPSEVTLADLRQATESLENSGSRKMGTDPSELATLEVTTAAATVDED